MKKQKPRKNPKLFEKELNSLMNSWVWIFVYGKSLRLRLRVLLRNKKSELFSEKELQSYLEQPYVGVTFEGVEINFMPSMIEKIESDVIYLKIDNKYGEDQY